MFQILAPLVKQIKEFIERKRKRENQIKISSVSYLEFVSRKGAMSSRSSSVSVASGKMSKCSSVST